MKILLVEDEPLIAEMAAEYLHGAGHTIMGPAATVSEALALCRQEVPDVAVLDISLKDGSSGVELARALFLRWGLIAIFASGEMMVARRAQDVALGALSKPYELQALLHSVELTAALRAGHSPSRWPRGFELFSRPNDDLLH